MADKFTNLLDRLWVANPSRVFLTAIALAPVSVLLTILMSHLLLKVFALSGTAPNSVEETLKEGLGATRVISAVVVAPIVENLLCLIWAKLMTKREATSWWTRPLLIASIAAFSHALIFGDVRPFAVLPGFFIMSALIVNVRNTKVGYWSSVVHHSLINVINIFVILVS